MIVAPRLADHVIYRGNQGLCTPRAAIVVATTDTLDPRGVAAGKVPALTGPAHVHLWVFTPGRPGFAEMDVPYGGDELAPGTWAYPPTASRLIQE